jgi:hypothetical protein
MYLFQIGFALGIAIGSGLDEQAKKEGRQIPVKLKT